MRDNTLLDHISEDDMPLPGWVKGVYGDGDAIVMTNGIPGGESDWEDLKTVPGQKWDPENTFLVVENGRPLAM